MQPPRQTVYGGSSGNEIEHYHWIQQFHFRVYTHLRLKSGARVIQTEGLASTKGPRQKQQGDCRAIAMRFHWFISVPFRSIAMVPGKLLNSGAGKDLPWGGGQCMCVCVCVVEGIRSS